MRTASGVIARAFSVLTLFGPLTLWADTQLVPRPLRESPQRFRWASHLQVRYTSVEDGENLLALRRLKLMFGGNLSERVQWYAQGIYKDGNQSCTDGRVYLQEAWLRFAWSRHLQVTAGQLKPAFGRDRLTPDFELYTIDRALISDTLNPAGPYAESFARDRGVQLEGELEHRFSYAFGVFDGGGANHAFRRVAPLVVSQLLHRPLHERPVLGRPLTVEIGGATAFRRIRDLSLDRRWGAEFTGDWGDLSVRAEYMRGRADLSQRQLVDGWYLQVSKFLTRRWQAVGKMEELNDAWERRQTTVGVNYYLRQNRLKLMTAYVAREARVAGLRRDLVQCQLQVFLH